MTEWTSGLLFGYGLGIITVGLVVSSLPWWRKRKRTRAPVFDLSEAQRRGRR